ncbi:4-phosphoerythronate dehydrogenase [Alteromonas ponticola]|uniref:Erythronate-4-phosphate dehydrogenase n=1 Tax=Alteromonas ponticola TaxID=2720613 RepID=A0ABX1R4C1_9ALTE|nr:4-phosphoerythronate dehydrogenase [Alteromonas ponticola]NMH61292.1 4-phosphoerythronate dehydrogenase [Alteromonas ponticola]
MTKILYEDSIPKAQEYFDGLGDVASFPSGNLAPHHLDNVSMLVVRSTTKINQATLAGNHRIAFVTTATAGTNHFDKAFLAQAGIAWNSAAGCNARSVAEWVISALLVADEQNRIDLANATVGIVGAGNVGSMLAALLTAMNIRYKLCDPPLQKQGDQRALVALDEILTCDVISLHVPFTAAGVDATANLLSSDELNSLSQHQLLINACRGEVIDEPALRQRMQQPDAPTLVLDVFDDEPDIDMSLLPLCFLATPHIAGHSVEGKLRGTQLVYEQVCSLLGQPVQKQLEDFLSTVSPMTVDAEELTSDTLSIAQWRALLLPIYDIREDDKHFRQSMAQSNQFAALRKAYRVRREISSCTLSIRGKLHKNVQMQLKAIGFKFESGCNNIHSG